MNTTINGRRFDLPALGRHVGLFVVLVTGGRDFSDELMLFDYLDLILAHCVRNHLLMRMVEGGARGADRLARTWAWHNHVQVATERAQWDRDGKAAGHKRNQLMIDKYQPDMCLAMPGGTGTADCVQRARTAGIIVLQETGEA